MVSIIELSNKTNIDSSLYSFHTLEGGGGGATNPTFFIKQQDKPYDHITNAVVSELKLLIQTKNPQLTF